MRSLLVFTIIIVGAGYALTGPFYALLFYLWLAYFRPEQWVWNADLINQLNLSYLAGFALIIHTVFSTKVKWRLNLRVALLGAFLFQSLASTMFTQTYDFAWDYWVEFLKTMVVAYLMVVVITDFSKLKLTLLVMAVSLGFEGAKQGWVELIRHPGAKNFNELPMLGDNNGVAVGMLMLVPLLSVVGSMSKDRRIRLGFQFLAIGVLYRAIVTYSRGGFLAAIGLGVAYLLRSPKKVPALAGILVASMVIYPILTEQFWERMGTIEMPVKDTDLDSDGVSTISRIHFWGVAVDMANEFPMFGVGHNAFNVNYNKFDYSNGEYGTGRSVHSSWFGLLAELGYPGLLIFIGLLTQAFIACWRARRVARLGPEFEDYRKVAFALEAALIVFIVGGTFLAFQYTEMLWHVIALTIALNGLSQEELEKARTAQPDVSPFRKTASPLAVAS